MNLGDVYRPKNYAHGTAYALYDEFKIILIDYSSSWVTFSVSKANTTTTIDMRLSFKEIYLYLEQINANTAPITVGSGWEVVKDFISSMSGYVYSTGTRFVITGVDQNARLVSAEYYDSTRPTMVTIVPLKFEDLDNCQEDGAMKSMLGMSGVAAMSTGTNLPVGSSTPVPDTLDIGSMIEVITSFNGNFSNFIKGEFFLVEEFNNNSGIYVLTPYGSIKSGSSYTVKSELGNFKVVKATNVGNYTGDEETTAGLQLENEAAKSGVCSHQYEYKKLTMFRFSVDVLICGKCGKEKE
jgi:hypothetical protein